MRIFSSGNIGDEALFLTVEVDENKGKENKSGNDSVASERRFRSEVGHEQS